MCQTLAGVNWHRLWWSCSGLIQLSICPLVLKKLTILCTKNTVIFLLPFSPFLTYISHQFYFPGEHISGQQISRLHHFLDSNPRPSFFFFFFFPKLDSIYFIFQLSPLSFCKFLSSTVVFLASSCQPFYSSPIHLAVPLTFTPLYLSL